MNTLNKHTYSTNVVIKIQTIINNTKQGNANKHSNINLNNNQPQHIKSAIKSPKGDLGTKNRTIQGWARVGAKSYELKINMQRMASQYLISRPIHGGNEI